jgi:hypothetical protein
MEHTYRQRNAAGRQRLRALVDRLSDADLVRSISDGWTVAAILAHLAFWDRFVLVRWQHAAREGQRVPAGVADMLLDLINEASLAAWQALPPRVAAQQAIAAAETIEQLVAALPDDVAAEAISSGRAALLDRTLHWTAHLDEIEQALGRPQEQVS